ncbi:GntR family transcriptional regulator [Paraburkholderia acidisoli]|nr:GntR family transcriptional regulator [Paraburkholderia acidisoli]
MAFPDAAREPLTKASTMTDDPHTTPALRGDNAYTRIRHDVLSCRIMPGATFTESQLMERYALGKSSCHVALVRLVHEGLVRAMPRQGYRVAPITVRDVEEVFAMRVQLEPLAARLACGRLDAALLKRLDDVCRVRHPEREVSEQIDEFLDTNRAFHLAIAEASGNTRLYRTLAGLMDEMSRLVALGFGVEGTRPDLRHDHDALVEAFEAKDARRSETIARRHIETFRAMTLDRVYASLSRSGAVLPAFTVAELRG